MLLDEGNMSIAVSESVVMRHSRSNVDRFKSERLRWAWVAGFPYTACVQITKRSICNTRSAIDEEGDQGSTGGVRDASG